MAFSLNKIMLIGNLGRDAETRFTNSDKAVTTYSIATTNSYKGKDGNWVNDTTWHDIVSWNLSDFIKERLVKGAKVYVEGRLNKRNYENKEGVKIWVTEVVSTNIILLGDRENASASTGSNEAQQPKIEDQVAPSAAEDDDLPF